MFYGKLWFGWFPDCSSKIVNVSAWKFRSSRIDLTCNHTMNHKLSHKKKFMIMPLLSCFFFKIEKYGSTGIILSFHVFLNTNYSTNTIQLLISIVSTNSNVLKSSRPANRNSYQQFMPRKKKIKYLVPLFPTKCHCIQNFSEMGFHKIFYLIFSHKKWF